MSLFNFKTQNSIKRKIDLENFLVEACKETAFTPDAALLERREFCFVFLPDEFMSGRMAHSLLGDEAHKKSIAFTEEFMSLWHRRTGELSTIIPLKTSFKDVPLRRIRGELWKIRPQVLFKLDSYRRNGVEFVRERVNLMLPLTKLKYGQNGKYWEKESFTDNSLWVWMYVGKPEYWNDLIDGGFAFTPVTVFKAKNPILDEYYHFTGNYDGYSK